MTQCRNIIVWRSNLANVSVIKFIGRDSDFVIEELSSIEDSGRISIGHVGRGSVSEHARSQTLLCSGPIQVGEHKKTGGGS